MKKLLLLFFIFLPFSTIAQKSDIITENKETVDTVVATKIRATEEIKAPIFKTTTDTLTTVKALRDSVNMLLDSIAKLRDDIGSGGVTPTDDILDWSTDKYTPYSDYTTGTGYNLYFQSSPSSTSYPLTDESTKNLLFNHMNIYAPHITIANRGSAERLSIGRSAISIIDGSSNTVFSVGPGAMQYKCGGSVTNMVASGVLKDFYVDSTTNSTSETDLYAYTVPANLLQNNGDKLIFNVTLDATSSSTNSYIRFYFAGDSVVWSDNKSLTGYGNATFEIIRVSSSVCRVSVRGTGVTTTWSALDVYAEFTSKDFTTTNILKVTGQCATNSITARFGYIEYKPAAVN